jgi:hypothetical protein
MLSTSKPTHRAWVALVSPGTKRGGLLPRHTAFLVRGDVSENLCGACAFFTTRRNGSTLPLPTKSSLAASRPDAARHARIQRTGSRATRRGPTTPVCCGASAVVRHRSVPHSQRNSVNSGLVNSPPRSDLRPITASLFSCPPCPPLWTWLRYPKLLHAVVSSLVQVTYRSRPSGHSFWSLLTRIHSYGMAVVFLPIPF